MNGQTMEAGTRAGSGADAQAVDVQLWRAYRERLAAELREIDRLLEASTAPAK